MSPLTDDSEPFSAKIVSHTTFKDHTEYSILVTRGYDNQVKYSVGKRYSEFENLYNLLSKSFPQTPQIPPKKVIGKLNSQFVQRRLDDLQNFLNLILQHFLLSRYWIVKEFLETFENSRNINDVHTENTFIFFRNDNNWTVHKLIGGIGWRGSKNYFTISRASQNKQKTDYLLSFTEFSADRSLSSNNVEAIVNLCGDMQCQLIIPPVSVHFSISGMYSTHVFIPNGSVRDQMSKNKYSACFLKKMSCEPVSNSLAASSVNVMALHVLKALEYLHSHGFFHGNVQLGNVFFINGIYKLAECESSLVGSTCLFRPFCVGHRAIKSTEAFDVYCFGHLLYEATTGRLLTEPFMDTESAHVLISDHDLVYVLSSVLGKQALKSGIPSIATLLEYKYFKYTTDYVSSLPTRIPSKIQGLLQTHSEKWLERLIANRKMIKKGTVRDRLSSLPPEEKNRILNLHKKQSKASLGGVAKEITSESAQVNVVEVPKQTFIVDAPKEEPCEGAEAKRNILFADICKKRVD